MYNVILIEPTHERCGGNTKTEDKPAEVYATLPTGIIITQTKELRKVKFKNKSFFRATSAKYQEYWCCDRGWHYETKKEAIDKMFYESKHCGHLMQTKYGWCAVGCAGNKIKRNVNLVW